jgi:large subunit ribosomal protein L14e
VNFGEDYGKMVVIVDMLDINRVLIDSPDGSMPRLVYPLKRLTLSKIKVKSVLRGCRTGTLKKLAKAQDTVEGFKKTPVAIKMDKYKTRSNLTDFEKFKVMVLRKHRSWRKSHLNEKPPPVKKAPAKKEVPPSPSKGGKGKKGGGDVPASPGNKNVPPSPGGGKKKKGKKGQVEGN